MQEEVLEGVRDRKRAQTHRRIHEAAVELTLRDGLAAATVSEIAERAGISRRTFFNYYASKEDAVLGVQEPQIPPKALEAFLHPAPPDPDEDPPGDARFVQALHLTVTTMASIGPRTSADVRTIVATHPELIDRLRAHRVATQDLLVAVLTERLAEQTASTRASDSARALILLAGVVLRFAYGDDPDLLDDPEPAAIQKALNAFRDALKELK